MIVTETVTLNGQDFTHTYSGTGCEIERDGNRYQEAFDPVGSNRTYVECEGTEIEPDFETLKMQMEQIEEIYDDI